MHGFAGRCYIQIPCLTVKRIPQAIKYICYSIFIPPAQKDLKFSVIISRFVLFFTGGVGSGSLASCCESAALGPPGSCFLIPRESSVSASVL